MDVAETRGGTHERGDNTDVVVVGLTNARGIYIISRAV
jgi:hypothetical protein